MEEWLNYMQCSTQTQWSNCLFLHPPGITCPDLEDPSDGTVSVTGQFVGSAATYSCNEGFQLQGAVLRICQITGEWSPQAPVCKRE